MLKRIILVTAASVLFSCAFKKESPFEGVKNVGEKHISLSSLNLDSVQISHAGVSLTGKWLCKGDELVWGDYLTSKAFFYNKELKLEKTALGQGRGPKEIPVKRWTDFDVNNDRFVVFSSTQDYYVINKDWEVQRNRYEFKTPNKSRAELTANPQPEDMGIYEGKYMPNMTAKLLNDKYAIVPIETCHIKFNAFISRKFYEEIRIFGLLNLKDKKIERMFGRLSPEYRNYKFIPQFTFTPFDVYNNRIITGYDIDSSMYLMDTKGEIEFKFGFSGREMEQKYTEVQSTDDYMAIYQERKKHGHYTYIKCFPDQEIVFRGYTKDGNQATDGLQIYKDFNLIADLDVPKDMVVFGYIAPYFYAQLPSDLEKDTLQLNKFSL
ncbi:MAG: hypothetical protein MI784_09555 [Cytophagales bacterium]|nr:hypothetical protein [Cytophagales bacterium]